MERSRGAHPLAPLFYASFIVLAVFVVINLFVAVVLDNLERAKREEHGDPAPHEADVHRALSDIALRMGRLERLLDDRQATGSPRTGAR